MVALPVVGGGVVPVTVIENGARLADECPSVAVIVMPEVVPTLVEAGVPLSVPVAVLNDAQVGLLEILKERVRRFVSVAVGVNL